MSLAEFGRKEISLAETEMPGLMATARKEYGPKQPLKGARNRRLAAHDDPDRGPDRNAGSARRRHPLGLLQHLFDAGPRRGSDRGRRIPVFAVKGETLTEYWDYTAKLFDWHGGGTPNMILDDGGDATMLVHHGLRAERATSRSLDKPASEEEEVFFALIKKLLKEKPKGYFAEIAKNIKGVSEETTTGVHRLYQMEKDGKLLFRPSTSTTASPSRVRQPLWLPVNRWSTASAAAPT